jgi:hypothetical protein
LLEVIKAKAVFIANPKSNRKHQIMTQCHKNAIEWAEKGVAFLVFLSADAIFSDVSFYNLIKYSLIGKRAVMIAGLRVTKEGFVPDLKRNTSLKIVNR